MSKFDVVEASIADLRSALEDGRTTSVELVEAYQDRIAAFDGRDTGTKLNSVIVANPQALTEAAASDERRTAGTTLGPLDGIPYTAKDSYMVAGLTVASGSPAFADLIAQKDAFTIERLRADGAICLGLTNMPPMANGGMQRGLYGRAESPYSADWLTSAFASGSSNGSASPQPRASRLSASGKRPGRPVGHRLRTMRSSPTRPRAGSSACAGTGRSCRPWTSWSPTPERWLICSRSSTSSSTMMPRPAATSGASNPG